MTIRHQFKYFWSSIFHCFLYSFLVLVIEMFLSIFLNWINCSFETNSDDNSKRKCIYIWEKTRSNCICKNQLSSEKENRSVSFRLISSLNCWKQIILPWIIWVEFDVKSQWMRWACVSSVYCFKYWFSCIELHWVVLFDLFD